MKRKNLILALSLSAALLLSACGVGEESSSASQSGTGSGDLSATQEEQSSGDEQSTMPFTLGAYYSYSFHPVLGNSQANLTLAPLMYESLFTVDASFQAQPQLCQSYQVSDDGLTWTFQLRDGVTFSDGTALTGTTVAQALRLAMGADSRYAGRLSQVADIQGTGGTVTITLTQANGSLPLLLNIPISLGEGDRPLGTGPYVMYETDDGLELRLREDWWQGLDMPLTQIPLSDIGRGHSLSGAFNSGDITLMTADLTENEALGYSGSYQVWDYPSTNLIYLGFQTQRGVCATAEARRAIAQAVDRDRIVQSVFAGHAAVSTLPIHPSSPLYDESLAQELSYDPTPLKELEELSGRPVTLVVNIEDTAKSAAATYIAQSLEEAGLVVTVNRLPWEDYLSALQRGNFDLYLGEVILQPDFDLWELVASEGSLNYGRWTDRGVDSLLRQMEQAQDSQRQSAAFSLYDYLARWAPIAPICFPNGSVLTQYGRVSGIQPTQSNLFANLSQWTVK